jgi:hypothetical protein
MKKNNTSGFTGVTYNSKDKRWCVRISDENRKVIFSKQFISKEEAIKCKEQINIDYGFHPNHGK